MHPVITQAIAAERVREIHAQATAARHGRQLSRSQQAWRRWLPAAFPRAGRGSASLPVAWAAQDTKPAGATIWTAVGAGITWGAALFGPPV